MDSNDRREWVEACLRGAELLLILAVVPRVAAAVPSASVQDVRPATGTAARLPEVTAPPRCNSVNLGSGSNCGDQVERGTLGPGYKVPQKSLDDPRVEPYLPVSAAGDAWSRSRRLQPGFRRLDGFLTSGDPKWDVISKEGVAFGGSSEKGRQPLAGGPDLGGRV
jgi:hypothetical protein